MLWVPGVVVELQRGSELGKNQIEWKALRTTLGYEQSYLRVKEKGIVFGHQHVQLLVDKGYGEISFGEEICLGLYEEDFTNGEGHPRQWGQHELGRVYLRKLSIVAVV